MLKTVGRVMVSAVVPALALLAAGCTGGQTADDPSLVGTATVALTGVPADGTCIVITAVGNRTATRAIDAPAGSTMVLVLNGLPVGTVTFTAEAFAGRCSMRAGMVPNWISDAPFTATISIKPPTLVTLNLVKNGNVSVSVGFDDGPDAGSSGGAGAAGSGPIAKDLMQVAGVTGPETAMGFEGWFDLENVTIGATSALSTTGGTGVGKTSFTATARLRYQQGAPELYQRAVQGTHIQTVKFVVQTAGFVVWRATLSDVLVAGIATGGSVNDVPDLTVTFAFGKVDVEFIPQNDDGSPGPSTIVTWDILRNVGGSGGSVPFDFVLGGPAMPPAKTVSAFRAPSEMTLTSTSAGGGGVGKPVFSDASVTLPLDATVLQYLLVEASGRITQMGSVQLDTSGPVGPTPFGTYGFRDIALDGWTLSDLDTTVSFQAATFSWSVGTTVTMSPPPGP